ncbi:hypothetical protein Bbelb_076400 [Branchiostoma belcheri]|nr:hypothetical protein Bbelb_076400 [Branchiostoma belcheri]
MATQLELRGAGDDFAYCFSGTSLDYEAGRPGFDSGSYPNKSEHAPRRCTLGKGENEYLALARDVPRIGRKMEVPCLGESHPTHVKEPTALIEKNVDPETRLQQEEEPDFWRQDCV